MGYDAVFFLKDIIIVLLVFAIIAAMMKIHKLKEILELERRKRTMPLLTLEVDMDKNRGVYLINDSYCYAKNIDIDDVDFTVDYGFKKHITLKFPPVEILKPSARAKLDFRVFDGEYDITNMDSENILNHFTDAPIEMRLQFRNIEDDAFVATIESFKDRYITKDVSPVHEQKNRLMAH